MHFTLQFLGSKNIRLHHQLERKEGAILNSLGRIDGLARCKPFQAVLMALPSIVASEYGEADSVIKIGFFDV